MLEFFVKTMFYGIMKLEKAIVFLKKVLFYLSKIDRNFAFNKNFDKFLFDKFLTIIKKFIVLIFKYDTSKKIVDRDLIHKIKNLSLIFNPGHFAQLGIRKILSRGIKNSRLLWNLLSFEKIRTTNIGKGWPNRNHEKMSGRNQKFFKKEYLEKYCPA